QAGSHEQEDRAETLAAGSRDELPHLLDQGHRRRDLGRDRLFHCSQLGPDREGHAVLEQRLERRRGLHDPTRRGASPPFRNLPPEDWAGQAGARAWNPPVRSPMLPTLDREQRKASPLSAEWSASNAEPSHVAGKSLQRESQAITLRRTSPVPK